MGRVLLSASAVALCASAVNAGGIERSAQSVALLFEEGNYIEFNMGRVKPEVSGTQMFPYPSAAFVGADSGDMTENYNTYSLGLKLKVNEKLDFALIVDEPIGADVSYPMTGYLYGGSTADVNALATTALLRYRLPNNFSVIGGVRAIKTSGRVHLFTGYDMQTSSETDFGYVVGVAWEKPEIAARIALTYNSAVSHKFDATEVAGGFTFDTEFETDIPQSILLEGQTGIAKDTLVFGSVRWVDWSAFDISPYMYTNAPSNHFKDALVSYEDDTITYTLGVGRRFNQNWSGAVFVSHEAGTGGYAGNLGPTDGATALGLAATYTRDNLKITGGVRYVMIGDTKTEVPSAFLGGQCPNQDCGTFAEFEDNTAVAFGLRVGYSF
ncbi:outer membrane protein transport protein [Sedimentimonas flavescens]|uniref:outer membrane protein transport protein n=1 Tax=Sedimentimonas flavescens TaxID=2851012 RepID=UPI0035CCF75F